MRRKITENLSAWKASSNRKTLILFGARQTGKTYSVLEFGREAYARVVHVDFYKQPQLKVAFQNGLDPRSIITSLEALLHTDILQSETLLFLDEIQDCDEAITALKYFRKEVPEIDVIAAGSLLGVHVARKGSFPVGHVDMLTMHPMDFEEFCWAVGEQRAFALVRESFVQSTPCAIHESMMSTYRDYLMVGGMPEVVQSWVQESTLSSVRAKQHDISVAYVADMAKYANTIDAAKIVACWESLPAQLAKESGSTKFMWKYVASGAKADRYASAIDWLVASGVAVKCTQVTDGIAPLKSFENTSAFKLYVADTGLLACAYDAQLKDLNDMGHRSARFRGGMAENYVMQQLITGGLTPYYWGMQSTHEVEFVLRFAQGVIPIEVKSGKRVSSTSAVRFAEKYKCPEIIRVTAKNFGATEKVRNIPLYAACLLNLDACLASV